MTTTKSTNNEVTAGSDRPPLVRIRPSKGLVSIDFHELWSYRELLYFLAWRDIKIRYKQTVMGISWAVIQPFFSMVVFTIFFGKMAKMPSDGVPYPIFSYSALVPWTFFTSAVSFSANSLVSNAELLKKVYFPRLYIPVAPIIACLVDFVLAFLLLLGIMAYYDFPPTVNIVWLPFFILLAVLSAFGIGLLLAAMNVMFRDVKYIVPFLLQLWLFITPVVYPTSMLKEPWTLVYSLNPMVGVVDGFRWALLGSGPVPGINLFISCCVSVLLLLGGVVYFRRMEKSFADVV